METPNIPLLRKAVEWVEEQDALPLLKRTWNQRWWAIKTDRPCGTAYCVAGKITHDLHPDWDVLRVQDQALDIATHALGLNEAQAEKLFFQDNRACDVRTIAEEIAGERL